MIKVNTTTLEATREELPKFLKGLKQESLMDLSWTDPALGVSEVAWWPEVNTDEPIDANTHKYGSELLVANTEDEVVEVSREVLPLSAEEVEALLKQYAGQKISEVIALHQQHLYSDVEVTFPTGPATIQFRNDTDRTNLSNVAAGAMACIIAGTPEALMTYRTKDDVINKVPAAETMQIAMEVLGVKQAVVDNAWKHKDAIRAIIDIQAVIDYDVTTGW